MGDVGALALGGALGTIAIIVRQEIVLAIMGGIFVVEALSVMLQVTWFKFTKKRYGEGRRLPLGQSTSGQRLDQEGDLGLFEGFAVALLSDNLLWEKWILDFSILVNL